MSQSLPDQRSLPIYAQIAQYLTRDIAAGRLVDGARLAPERELAKELSISVGTLRKALKLLHESGLLERVQGSGNYVKAAGIRDSLYAMFRLERLEGGGFPTAQLMSVDLQKKPVDAPEFGPSHMATRFQRLRFLDDIPVALEEIWLDSECGTLETDDVSNSLYHTYQTKLGLRITHAEDRVSLAPAPSWRPDGFARDAGEILGYVARRSWAGAAHPVEYSRTWFDPTRAVYVQRLQ